MDLVRTNRGWLAGLEQRLLDWLAARVPRWLSPDQLTAIGFGGAVLCFMGYVLARYGEAFLWLVNAGLVVNWLGDSLDGRMARIRGIARPRYGFFLDQSVDIASQCLFALGLGMSGYLRMEIAALGLATYLAMVAHGLLRAEVTRVFSLATAGMGLTEVRCIFFAANIVLFLLPPWPFALWKMTVTYADFLGIGWVAFHAGLFVWTTLSELRRLKDS